jgi:hypothetical protein
MVLKRELGFFTLIILFMLAISYIAFSIGYSDPFSLFIRLLALNGYIALGIAAMMSPFLKQITLFFKKSFTKVHHYFAAVGLLLITLHPITVFISALTLSVFLPNFSSLYLFFFFGGIEALILIYVAFGAALLRRKINAYFRIFHAFMYLALFIGVIHANLRGTDFQNIYIQIAFDAIFASALFAFGLKRLQFYRIKSRVKKNQKFTSEANNRRLK